MFTISIGETVDRYLCVTDTCPWQALSGTVLTSNKDNSERVPESTLYTPQERQRRDQSRWTLVQGILAPLQFLVFLVSLWLVVSYLVTGEGLFAATASVVVKTLVLYVIMVTGSIWEKEVFGKYLFARAFFWEDVVSMLVLGLHTAYLFVLVAGLLDAHGQLYLALAAYAAYAINATQFLLKLKAARREAETQPNMAAHSAEWAK